MFKTSLTFVIFSLSVVLFSCLTTGAATNAPLQDHRLSENPPLSGTSQQSEQKSGNTPTQASPILAQADTQKAGSIQKLVLQAGKAPEQIHKGQVFKSTFTATVLDSATNSPVPGVSVTVSYPQEKTEGKLTFATQKLQSDANGVVAFTPTKAVFPCNDFVTFSMQSKDGAQTAAIPYRVTTDRHRKGGVISILDYTKAGKPVRDNSRSASALLTALIKQGFSGIGLADFIDEIHAGSVSKIYQAAYNLIGSNSNFFIFGTVKYNGDITQSGATYSIPIVGEITCLDMKNGAILHHDVIEVVGTGTSEWAAMENARMELFGPAAANSIIYGM